MVLHTLRDYGDSEKLLVNVLAYLMPKFCLSAFKTSYWSKIAKVEIF